MEEQRARLHIVIGTSRCCLGDAGGLDEIRAGIEIAESASDVDMVIAGYSNLSSELHFMARLERGEARMAARARALRALRG